MPFTTELVALAGSNGIGDMVVGERTTGTGAWVSSLALPAGVWTVIVKMRGTTPFRSVTTESRLLIDGTIRAVWTPGTDGRIGGIAAVASDVNGGRSINIEATVQSSVGYFRGDQGWDFIAIRTG